MEMLKTLWTSDALTTRNKINKLVLRVLPYLSVLLDRKSNIWDEVLVNGIEDVLEVMYHSRSDKA